MNREKIKGILLILSGAAVLAAPYLLRLVQEHDTRMYVQEYEQGGDGECPEKERDALFLQEGVIGMIEITSLNLKLPVFEVVDAVTLDKGIGYMTETAPLGTNGNSVCTGHNGSRKGVFFTYLSSMEEGAEVTVTTKNNVTHRYKASEMRIVGPYDTWVTEESAEEILTLFTCASHGTKRFAVRCVYVME